MTWSKHNKNDQCSLCSHSRDMHAETYDAYCMGIDRLGSKCLCKGFRFGGIGSATTNPSEPDGSESQRTVVLSAPVPIAVAHVPKGVLKIDEEYREFQNALGQGAVLKQLCTLSDLLGSIRVWLHTNHPSITMEDLVKHIVK